jgi:hypothetical protein
MVLWNNWRFLSLLSEGGVGRQEVCLCERAWRVLVRGAKIGDELGLGSIVSCGQYLFVA